MGGLALERKPASIPDWLSSKIQEIPKRAKAQNFIRVWHVSGPYLNEEDDTISFLCSCKKFSVSFLFEELYTPLLFSGDRGENLVSKLLARILEVELGAQIGKRLLGAQKEEVLEDVKGSFFSFNSQDNSVIVEGDSKEESTLILPE